MSFPFCFLPLKWINSACLPMLERSITSLHCLHLDLSSFFELTNHDLNLPSSNHFWLNIVCFSHFQLKEHTNVNIHWFFIRNTIFKNIRLRLSNLAKEKKNSIWVKTFHSLFHDFPYIFLFSLTFLVFPGPFEKIPVYPVFAEFSFFFDVFAENVIDHNY